MCLLCYITPGSEPDWKGLENACHNNPDGFGWAIHHGEHIQIGKSMSYMTALEDFYDALALTDGNVHSMFHARWATHGEENVANCHPFLVGGKHTTVLAHNGVLPVDIPKGDPRSDTRYFAEELLPKRSRHVFDKDSKRRKLESWMKGSKMVVFTTESDVYAEPVYILNEDAGHWDKYGTWWSNDSYQYRYTRMWGTSHSKSAEIEWDLDDDDLLASWYSTKPNDKDRFCGVCNSWLSRVEYAVKGMCDTCESCLGCLQNRLRDCMCYIPASSMKSAEESAAIFESGEWTFGRNDSVYF